MKRLESRSSRSRLLSSAVVPVALGLGMAIAAAPQPAMAKEPLSNSLRAPSNPAAVPRPLQLAAKDACGAKKNPCGPCGAKKNPCGAKKAGGPCGAGGACGAGGPCGASGGAVSKACIVPRLASANPCGAKKNPCGAKANPCGAKANPCSPCGGAKPAAKLTDAEAQKAYVCLLNELKAAYAKSGNDVAKSYTKWKKYNTGAYNSDTHGGRFVNNYGNRAARDYIKYEKVKVMPVGAILAKDSFQAMAGGKLAYGPLFVMEKMRKGWLEASGDWKYTMIMPDGAVLGTTRGKGADKVKFCAQCHMAVSKVDSLLFIPKKYRVSR